MQENKFLTFNEITLGDLESAAGYAEAMSESDQNPELYAAEAAALRTALDIISKELNPPDRECHWFWLEDWKL